MKQVKLRQWVAENLRVSIESYFDHVTVKLQMRTSEEGGKREIWETISSDSTTVSVE